MSDATIKIKNCKNITNGEIAICAGKLNILFGCNGTGKTTIAQAIELKSQGKDLSDLAPYGITSDDAPEIDGVPLGSIAIFDNEYVSKYVYQPDTLIDNAFEILVRTKEYDEAKKNIDDALSKIKTTLTGRKEIVDLHSQIGILVDKIRFTSSNRIARRGGIGGVLSGKGAYFNPPKELSELKPFFEEDTVSKWADWRLRGYEQFGSKGRCPYCSTGDTEMTNIINQVFVESFDKPSVENAVVISKALEELKAYLNEERSSKLLSSFGVKEDLEFLEAQLSKLGVEAKHLNEKLTAIVTFNGLSVDKDNLANLETTLKEMKVDPRICDTYFVSDLMENEIGIINTEIDNLLGMVDVLKGEIGKYGHYIQATVKEREKDINEFLSIAGFKYTFQVEIDGENKARALLKYILPDGNPGDIQSPGKSLSWGERHAFALIMFMYDAISRNADLVILDDPISSFDNNKKYAIINRLFKTGNKENSLYQRTVLMLTHDFEPVIDYIQVGAGRQDPSAICATYFENINGQLKCTPIQKNSDLMSSIILLKELAKDTNVDIAARIGCLRKFIEHQYRNAKEESEAYNIISSLIHGRNEPTYDREGLVKLTEVQRAVGVVFIKEFIHDFDYASILAECTPLNLIKRYFTEQSAYIKMLILRAYIERDEEARERLRKTNDVLRKYVDETNHIENDYLYSLDVRKFNIVPDYFINEANTFVENENVMLNLDNV